MMSRWPFVRGSKEPGIKSNYRIGHESLRYLRKKRGSIQVAIRPGRQGNPQGTRLSRLLESHAMGLLRSCPGLLFAVLLLSVQSLAAQNFEFGGHAGVAILGSEGPTLSPDTNVGGRIRSLGRALAVFQVGYCGGLGVCAQGRLPS